MKEKQIHTLLENNRLPGNCDNAELKETHISWLILCDNYVFKIKKPVKFSFVDFSTPEKRKYFCDRELELNRRLEPEMYLEVIPLKENMFIDKTDDNDDDDDDQNSIIDYAVKMKRMDNEKEMIRMIKEDQLEKVHIEKIANKIAKFHQETDIIKNAFNTSAFIKDYAKILKNKDFISEYLGENILEKVEQSVKKSKDFLNANRSFMNDRITQGLRRDCHGDLNIHNIFLYDEPVIFDCIEFNDELRQIDILSEIAFLAVDLDFNGKSELADQFIHSYIQNMNIQHDDKEEQFLNFYKSYRANVRALVSILHESSENKEKPEKSILKDIEKYIALMNTYISSI